MSIVVKMPSTSQPRERRLHLREISEEIQTADIQTADVLVPSVGTVLRERRAERGLDERVIATTLKMRIDHLRAIECDDFARLPGPTYAVGFIRSYSRYLGLDSNVLVDHYKKQTAASEINQPVELIFPEVAVEQHRPNGNLLIVALVVAVVIYGVAQVTMPSRPTAVTVASASETVVVVDPGLAPKPARVVPVVATEVSPVNLDSPESSLVDEVEQASLFTVVGNGLSALAEPESIIVAAATGQANESPLPASRITLTAIEATYVQIKDPGLRKPHSILLARVLNPGESFQAPDRSGLVLLTGNAGGIQVEVDGRSAGVLGKSGQVIKRLPLEPAYFLSRTDTSR